MSCGEIASKNQVSGVAVALFAISVAAGVGTHGCDRQSGAALRRIADRHLSAVFNQDSGPVGKSGGAAARPLYRATRARACFM